MSSESGLQHTATHTLQRTATHCNALQRTATHCNTLQHTATHCNTLQHYMCRGLTRRSWSKSKVCCNVLQRGAVCCSVLQFAVCCGMSKVGERQRESDSGRKTARESECVCIFIFLCVHCTFFADFHRFIFLVELCSLIHICITKKIFAQHTHADTHTYTHTHAHTRPHTYTLMSSQICVYAQRGNAGRYVCQVSVCVCVCVCVHVYMYTCIHVCRRICM